MSLAPPWALARLRAEIFLNDLSSNHVIARPSRFGHDNRGGRAETSLNARTR
jgi:hypothetical protein